jgi:60 kDa SS-A/Ro ribonucleoprotein
VVAPRRAAAGAPGAPQRRAARALPAHRRRGAIEGPPSDALAQVRAVDALHADAEIEPARAAAIVREARLTREMVPTPLLRHAQVWEALLEEMPLTALVRNLATLTRVGVLAPGSDASAAVAARLADGEALRRARVHPVQVLSALRTYSAGRGVRGKGTWAPVAQVVDALDAAFYLAFAGVEPSGRRVMLALDVSGSMMANVHGLEGLSCREASAAMALVTAATEPRHFFTAFTAGGHPSMHPGFPSGISPLAMSPRQRLDNVVREVSSLPFGGTDCALPMLEAAKRGWQVDLFVIYTDNETWAGDIHPSQALRRYRERTGIPAKLVVVGMASNGFTIADPGDAGMLDVVGFDAATPQLIADFAR